jgi:predicted CoA-binding protein
MSLELVKQILTEARVVGVLGAHDDPAKPASYVPEYLSSQGYTIIPINGAKAGVTRWGRAVLGSLAEVGEPLDVLDVFRRPEALPAHLPEILAMSPLPKVVWLQQGIRHDEFAAALEAHGVTVIQDRCMLADHRRLQLPPLDP